MIWAFLSIFAGLFDAISFSFMKRINNLDQHVKQMFINLMALIFIPIGFLFYSIPKTGQNFYLITLITTIIFLIAQFLMLKSLQISSMSMSVPMLSFTPVFLLLMSYIFLNEFPTFLGIIGIFVIVVGSYILNISSVKHGYLEPLKSMFRNKGVFYMLVVAFLFSFTANLAKIGINLSNPAYYMLISYLFSSIILAALFLKKAVKNKKQIKNNFKYLVAIGVATALSEITIAVALKNAIVPYVISLKRTSVLFSVIIGFLFFREKNFKHAITGALIMFAGAALIMLS